MTQPKPPTATQDWSVGQPVRVRFPDSTIATLPLSSELVDTSYGDMSHWHPSKSELPGVTINHHGIELFVPLGALEVVAKDWEGVR